MRRLTDLPQCKGTLKQPVEPNTTERGMCPVCRKRVKLSKYGHVAAHPPATGGTA